MRLRVPAAPVLGSPRPTLAWGTLVGLEACPRRWSLDAVREPDGSPRFGRSPAAWAAALRGVVVHDILRRVYAGFADSGRPFDRQAAVREVGGLQHLLRLATEQQLAEASRSPRLSATTRLEVQRILLAGEWAEEVVAAVKSMLRAANVSLPIVTSPPSTGRGALSEHHLAVELADGHWTCRPDLVEVEEDHVVLSDFKTSRNEEHTARVRDQLVTYAVLWHARYGGRQVQLRLINRSGAVQVGELGGAELRAARAELERRGAAARAAWGEAEPRPGELCSECGVRAACAAFWAQAASAVSQDQWLDVELEVVAAWEADLGIVRGVVRACPSQGLEVSESVRVEGSGELTGALRDARPGDVVRLLGAHLLKAAPPVLRLEGPRLRTGLRGAEVWWVEAH